MHPALPRAGPARPSKPDAAIPFLFGVARANRKKPKLDHHYLGPELTVFRSSSGAILDRPLVISSLGKGQQRTVYTAADNVVMKVTTELSAHGSEHAFSLMFQPMAAQVLGHRELSTQLVFDGCKHLSSCLEDKGGRPGQLLVFLRKHEPEMQGSSTMALTKTPLSLASFTNRQCSGPKLNPKP